MSKPDRIQLGCRVRDRITGLEGIVTAKCIWLHRSPTYEIQPQGLQENGALKKSTWLPGDFLEVELDADAAIEPTL